MAGEADTRFDALHGKTLEAVKERANPVTRTFEILDYPEIDVSKPTVHERLDDLEDWGYIERLKVGRAFAIWPAGKYEGMERRLKELIEDKEYLERRVDEVEVELSETRQELTDARKRKRQAEKLEEEATLSPERFLAPDFPTELPDELEFRWRVRAESWRANLARYGTMFTFATLLMLVVLFSDFTPSSIPYLPAASVDIMIGIFGIGYLAVIILFAYFAAAEIVGLIALRSQQFASLLDTPARLFERLGSGLFGDSEAVEEAPTGTDRVLNHTEE